MKTTPNDWKAAWNTEQPTDSFVDEVMYAVELAAGTPTASRAAREHSVHLQHAPRGARRKLIANVAAGVLAVAAVAAAGAYLNFRQADQRPYSSLGKPSPLKASDNTSAQLSAAPQLAVASEHSTAPQTSAKTKRDASGLKLSPKTVLDRVRREHARERLHSLNAPSVEVDPHTGLTLPTDVSPGSLLSREYLQERIREDFFPVAMHCYESALVDKPNLQGKIVLDFMIIGEPTLGGIVDQAKLNTATDISDLEFQTCMLGSMLSMVFEAPDAGGWITVTYPFEFKPD